MHEKKIARNSAKRPAKNVGKFCQAQPQFSIATTCRRPSKRFRKGFREAHRTKEPLSLQGRQEDDKLQRSEDDKHEMSNGKFENSDGGEGENTEHKKASDAQVKRAEESLDVEPLDSNQRMEYTRFT